MRFNALLIGRSAERPQVVLRRHLQLSFNALLIGRSAEPAPSRWRPPRLRVSMPYSSGAALNQGDNGRQVHQGVVSMPYSSGAALNSSPGNPCGPRPKNPELGHPCEVPLDDAENSPSLPLKPHSERLPDSASTPVSRCSTHLGYRSQKPRCSSIVRSPSIWHATSSDKGDTE